MLVEEDIVPPTAKYELKPNAVHINGNHNEILKLWLRVKGF